jgi:hypothetical protein
VAMLTPMATRMEAIRTLTIIPTAILIPTLAPTSALASVGGKAASSRSGELWCRAPPNCAVG